MKFDFAATAAEINKLQDKINQIHSAAEAKAAPFEEELKSMQEVLQQAMLDSGLKEFKDGKSIAEIKTSLRIGIQDYAALEQFVYRRKALHLFERRIGSKAYNELKEALGNKPVPGLSEFNQIKLNVKRAK